MDRSGGHIHISWNGVDKDYMSRQKVVKAGDMYISIPSLLLDNDVRRRSLYGKAGAFRPKSYGVELRSPSNFWTKSTSLMSWVYYAAIRSVMDMEKDFPDVQDVINNNRVDDASDIIAQYNIPMPAAYGG